MSGKDTHGRVVRVELFEVFPQNFFSLFASPNRTICAEALLVLHRHYRQETRLKKAELVSRLVSGIETRMLELEAEEGDPYGFGEEVNLSGRAHFLLRKFLLKVGLPENRFYLDGMPMNIKTLKAWLLNHYSRQYQFFESNRDYREVLSGVLGYLNERFFRLFRKAVPFSPIINIKQFITEFVCDVEKEVDITHMQENIRQYKQLEEELALVEKKVAALEVIAVLYRTYREEAERLRMQQYLLERAALEKRVRDMETLREEVAVLEESISNLRGKIVRDAYRTKLEKMKKDPAYAEFFGLIELMLKLNIRLEQEALLAEGDLQLAPDCYRSLKKALTIQAIKCSKSGK